MSNPIDDLLLEFHTDPRFKLLKEHVVKARPTIQSYRPDDLNSVEKWKYESGLKDGFELALSYFKME